MPLSLDLKQNFATPTTVEYSVNSNMFESMENSLVKGGKLTVGVTAHQAPEGIRLAFSITGKAVVECDRCLEDMEVDINTREEVCVQNADHYEDAADVVYVDESLTQLDLWPMVYDFIVLAIPISHHHPEGQCNKDMSDKLSQYMVQQPDEDKDE